MIGADGPLSVGRGHRSVVRTGGKVGLANVMVSVRSGRLSFDRAGVVTGFEGFTVVLRVAGASSKRPMDRDPAGRLFNRKRSRCGVNEIRNRAAGRDRRRTRDL